MRQAGIGGRRHVEFVRILEADAVAVQLVCAGYVFRQAESDQFGCIVGRSPAETYEQIGVRFLRCPGGRQHCLPGHVLPGFRKHPGTAFAQQVLNSAQERSLLFQAVAGDNKYPAAAQAVYLRRQVGQASLTVVHPVYAGVGKGAVG